MARTLVFSHAVSVKHRITLAFVADIVDHRLETNAKVCAVLIGGKHDASGSAAAHKVGLIVRNAQLVTGFEENERVRDGVFGDVFHPHDEAFARNTYHAVERVIDKLSEFIAVIHTHQKMQRAS